MICGNCAEASALRKAFPSTLAQMYCREELEREIESGDRDRTQRIEMATASTKSEAIATILASRVSQKKEESQQTTENNDVPDNEPILECESDPVSRLADCLDALKREKIECIDSDPEGTRFKFKLANDSVMTIGNGVSGGGNVDTWDADALDQVLNTVEAAKPKKRS